MVSLKNMNRNGPITFSLVITLQNPFVSACLASLKGPVEFVMFSLPLPNSNGSNQGDLAGCNKTLISQKLCGVDWRGRSAAEIGPGRI